jgi:hypothetical protein
MLQTSRAALEPGGYTSAKRSVSEPLWKSDQVRAYFGGISHVTLHRWLKNPELGFPKPRVIQRRRFWRPEEIEEFSRRSGKQAA